MGINSKPIKIREHTKAKRNKATKLPSLGMGVGRILEF